MIYWDNMDTNRENGAWDPIDSSALNDLSGLWNDLSGLLEYCADYCRNSINCNAVKAEQNDKVGFRKWDCWFNYDGFEYNYSQFQCYGSTCNDNYSYNGFMSPPSEIRLTMEGIYV